MGHKLKGFFREIVRHLVFWWSKRWSKISLRCPVGFGSCGCKAKPFSDPLDEGIVILEETMEMFHLWIEVITLYWFVVTPHTSRPKPRQENTPQQQRRATACCQGLPLICHTTACFPTKDGRLCANVYIALHRGIIPFPGTWSSTFLHNCRKVEPSPLGLDHSNLPTVVHLLPNLCSIWWPGKPWCLLSFLKG